MDPVTAVRRLGADTQGLVTHRQLMDAGVSRASLSRAVHRDEVVRVRPRVYGLAALPALPDFLLDGQVAQEALVHVRAHLLEVGTRAAVAGRSAALLWGWEQLVEPCEVELLVPHERRVCSVRRTGALHLVQGRPAGVVGAPFPVLSAEGTAIDCCLTLPLIEAVAVVDSGLRAREVDLDDLVRAGERLDSRQQRARVSAVLALVDPFAGSVLESATRVHLVQAGLTGFTTQLVVRHRGRRVHRVDFAFAAQRLVVEVDGRRWHAEPARDRRTDNALARAGWRVLRYTWADVVHDPVRVVTEIREALEA